MTDFKNLADTPMHMQVRRTPAPFPARALRTHGENLARRPEMVDSASS